MEHAAVRLLNRERAELHSYCRMTGVLMLLICPKAVSPVEGLITCFWSQIRLMYSIWLAVP